MFYKTIVRGLLVAALVAAMQGGTAVASFIPPPGLAPGTQYEIAFVTSGATTATSANIADYNNFVTQQAALSTTLPAGLTWKVIASTASTNAINNAPTYASVPIYNTNGQLVASGSSNLWTSSLVNPIDYDENGNLVSNTYVWTGGGETAYNGGLGDFYTAPLPNSPTDAPILGCSWLPQYWDEGAPVLSAYGSNVQMLTGVEFPLYALSSPVAVVPVPEPTSLALVGTALLGLVPVYLRRRRAKA